MFDPVVEFFVWLFEKIGRGIGFVIALLLWPFRALAAWYSGRGWILKILFGVLILGWLVAYGFFFWNSQRWTGFNPAYIAAYDFENRKAAPGAKIGGNQTDCGQSAIIKTAADLIDFNVNQNEWMPSTLLYKLGFFGLDWKHTPFFDNKAAFQLGINEILRRTTQEAVDRLARIRGTSQIDQNLQNARQDVYYPEDLWYVSLSPVGATTPTPKRHRNAINNLRQFNERLGQCKAVFDPRADNLLRLLDQYSNAMGSTSDILNDRMDASNAGWFDMRADDRFWFAYGQLYALNGIMAATRSDFKEVIEERNLGRSWDKEQESLKNALSIQPLIISNGSESAFLMPSHLATMGFYLLRVRANMTEMRDILDR